MGYQDSSSCLLGNTFLESKYNASKMTKDLDAHNWSFINKYSSALKNEMMHLNKQFPDILSFGISLCHVLYIQSGHSKVEVCSLNSC